MVYAHVKRNFAHKIGQLDNVYGVRVCLRLLTEGQKAASLLACSLGCSGDEEGKGRRACNYVCGI